MIKRIFVVLSIFLVIAIVMDRYEVLKANKILHQIESFTTFDYVQSVTIEKEIAQELFPKATYKSDFYGTNFILCKGMVVGRAKLKNDKEIEAHVCRGGNYFQLEGFDGYFVFEGESQIQWKDANKWRQPLKMPSNN